ncbi:hypothetical protein ACP4OV_003713 [Aristida adscensionis]
MRSGGCAVQQALAAEAAAVTREAVALARRRGHAQVTPLHVASAMLADAGGPLRAACLRARSGSRHPLRWKALELCFNVALNRLATAAAAAAAAAPSLPAVLQFHHAAGAVVGHHRAPPALSNALAAAFKRAQASQRRGGSASAAEGAQQAAAVELEQLLVSILDDPSVSRVMREAGFDSAEVKACVEKAASSEHSSTAASGGGGGVVVSPTPSPKGSNKAAKVDVAGDATRVLDCMAGGARRCVVVAGESAAAAEAVVKAVMDRVSKGELQRQHERLRSLQFVPLSAASFQRAAREEVAARAGDLRALVREGRAAGKGVVLVLKDLGYAAEAWAAASRKRNDHGHGGNYCYCPVEHAVMEVGGLVRDGGDMFWLLGFGSYSSYKSCRTGQPPLEAVLELHAVVVPEPDGGLALSLAGASELACCGSDRITAAAAAAIPSWLRRCQGPVLTGAELTLSFSSPAASPTSGLTHYDANPSSDQWRGLLDRQQQWPGRRHGGLSMAESYDHQLLMNPYHPGSSTSVSNSSEGARGEPPARRRAKFTELTAENLKILCDALETRVPRHADVAPGIASAVLRRRSGVTPPPARPASATWLLFQGRDGGGKTAMARELARLVFGSYADFTSIAPSPTTELTAPAHSGSSSGGELSLKRRRSPENEHGGGYVQRLYEAIRDNPHRVVHIVGIDGVERAGHGSEAGIKNAIVTGAVRGCDGDVVSLEDAIVVLSCESCVSTSRASSPRMVKQRINRGAGGEEDEEDGGVEKGAVQPRVTLDLNAFAIDEEEGEEEGSSLDHVEILADVVDGVFFFPC